MEYAEKEVAGVRERNGWLFRWWKRLKCGMIYGHEYRQVSLEVQGMVGCECRWCGKAKVF